MSAQLRTPREPGPERRRLADALAPINEKAQPAAAGLKRQTAAAVMRN